MRRCLLVVPAQRAYLRFLSIVMRMYCCYRLALEDSSLSPTEPVVRCLMLSASLVKKSLKLLQFLALVGLSCKASHGRFNNTMSSMERYSEQRIFSLVNGSSPALENSLQSSM